MRSPTRRRSAVVWILALFLAPAALLAAPTRRAEAFGERDSGGLLAFVQSVLTVFWGENGDTLTDNHGPRLEPNGDQVSGDHGSVIEPNG